MRIRLSLLEWSYLVLSGVVVTISTVKALPFPIIDASLFEYFGRAMLHGQRLCIDLVDNKPPSIYLVNMLWQALFGPNYALHKTAEGAINLGSVVLFALALRKAGVGAWALGTFLFSFFFLIPYPQFDLTQHYAVFFIVLGIYLQFAGRTLWSGVALGAASTFWVPSALTLIAILLRPSSKRERLAFVAGFAGLLALAVIVESLLFGPCLWRMLKWSGYVARTPIAGASVFTANLLHAAVLPGIVTLLALLAVVVRRPLSERSRFALTWSGCMLLGGLIPPTLLEHYFLPSTPALAMAIASFGIEWRLFVGPPLAVALRASAALVALVALALTLWQTVAEGSAYQRNARFYQGLGDWIRASTGPGAAVYTPDFSLEIQLAADATNLGLSSHPEDRQPDVVVAGPMSLLSMVNSPQPTNINFGFASSLYVPVCADKTGPYLIVFIASRKASKFRCENLKVSPWGE